MELPNLEAFLQVATLKSFSKAADSLHITQSSITLRVQSLEKELGQQLFIRSPRKVELSPAGLDLLPYIEQALRLLEMGKNKIENYAALRTGKLSIASIPTINFHEIPRLVSSLKRKWPELQINVTTGRTNFVIEKVLSGEAQIGLIRTPTPELDLYYKRLFDEDLVLVVSNKDSLASYESVDVKVLHGLKLIAHDTTTAYGQWMVNLLASRRVVPNIIIENDYLPAVKEMISQGVGAAILPITTVEEELDKGSLRAIRILGAGKLTRTVIAACNKSKINTPEIAAFFSVATKVYGNTAGCG